MTEMTRKEKMAQEKAAWEAAQAAKKAAKKTAKRAKKETPLENATPLESFTAPTSMPDAGTSDSQPGATQEPPKGRKAPKPPRSPKPPKAPKPARSKKTKGSLEQSAVLQNDGLTETQGTSVIQRVTNTPEDALVSAGLVVDLTSGMRDTKQARRVRTRNAKSSSKADGAKSAKKKSVTYKTALRMGLSEPVASMIEEKNRILRLWKSRKITPELAVSNLSVLQARDPDGSVWRLLPRHGGYALVRTGHDGVPSIVEPPRKRRAWPAVVGGVLFSILIVLALWGVVNPATDGEERIETPSTVVSE
jgi:hypothetical protein